MINIPCNKGITKFIMLASKEVGELIKKKIIKLPLTIQPNQLNCTTVKQLSMIHTLASPFLVCKI